MDMGRPYRRNAVEWAAPMMVINDSGEMASNLAGQRVQERFGAVRVYRNMLRAEDLNPDTHSAHGNNLSSVISQIQRGREGVFRIESDGSFIDYHGGNGFPIGNRGNTSWFTEAALNRGIGWTFIQTYLFNGTRIGRYHVSRIFTAPRPGANFKLILRKRPV